MGKNIKSKTDSTIFEYGLTENVYTSMLHTSIGLENLIELFPDLFEMYDAICSDIPENPVLTAKLNIAYDLLKAYSKELNEVLKNCEVIK